MVSQFRITKRIGPMFSSLLISSWADCNVTHDYAHLKLLTCKDPTGCKLRRKKHKTWITRLTFFLSETTDICKHLFTILFYFCRSRPPCVTHLALFFFDVISERDSLTWFPSVISGPHTYSFFFSSSLSWCQSSVICIQLPYVRPLSVTE